MMISTVTFLFLYFSIKRFNKNKIFNLLILAILFSSSVAFADSVNGMEIDSLSYSIDVRSYVIGWKYKTWNGCLYKRQYNYSTKRWIGEWIVANS
jgi:hypothetical protein